MAKLGECFSVIRNGASIRQTDGAGGFPITRIETIADKTINREKFGYAGIYDLAQYRDYILQDGDILMSHINSEKHLGKVALYSKRDDEQIIHGMNLLMLRADTQKVIPEYAKYYFESQKFLRQIGRITKKSVNQASFTVTALKELEIPLASIIVQRDVSEKLKKVDLLVSLRKQQLAKLDELVKARFVEKSKEWQAVPGQLNEFLEDITYGFTNPMPDAEEGPWKVTAKDVVNGHINILTARKTTNEAFERLTNKSKPRKGDVLLTKDGTLGRVAVVDVENLCVNQSVAVMRCNNKIYPEFLAMILQMPEYQRKLLEDSGGGTIKHLYITKVDKMLISVPDLVIQKDLLMFAKRVEQQKQTVQQSLEKLALMKKALMQEYFG